MAAYLARRVLYVVPTLLGIALLAFLLGRIAPGDPAAVYFQRINDRQPSSSELAVTRDRLGLDDSLPVQFGTWVTHAATGDLGVSFGSGRLVTDELASRLPATLQLAGTALLIAVVVAIPVGILAALYRNRWIDQLTRVAAMLGASMPGFWLAYLLIIAFAVELHWLPSGGRGGLDHLVLPALALGLADSAILARLMRSSLLEVMDENYVRTARAKGVPEWRIIVRHGVGNSLNAVLTQGALTFGWLLAYSAIIEIIFVWPGIGRLAIEAINQRDYPLIQGFVVFAGAAFVLINLVVDLLYVWLDPRVTLGQARAPAAQAA